MKRFLKISAYAIVSVTIAAATAAGAAYAFLPADCVFFR